MLKGRGLGGGWEQTEVNKHMQEKMEKAHHNTVEEFIHNPVSTHSRRVRRMSCVRVQRAGLGM